MTDLNELFEKIWLMYPRKDGKKLALKKFKKLFKHIFIYAMHKNKTVFEVFESWVWSELNKKEIIVNGKVSSDRKQYIPHFSTMLNQERWEDEPYTTESGTLIEGYFDFDKKSWVKKQIKPKATVFDPNREKLLEDYKNNVSSSAVKAHKKNIRENNERAEFSKNWLEQRGVEYDC